MNTNELRQLLKNRRIELGYSQGCLAQYLGLSHRSLVSRLESGENQWTLKNILKACELLKIEPIFRLIPLSRFEISEATERQKRLPPYR